MSGINSQENDLTSPLRAGVEEPGEGMGVPETYDCRIRSVRPQRGGRWRLFLGISPIFSVGQSRCTWEFYFPLYGWGREFETVFTEGLLDLMKRIGNGRRNQAWSAVLRQPGKKDRIVGTVFIDGEVSGEEGVARLRAFIVDEEARGLGAGRLLLKAAMEFVKGEGFEKCVLTTSKGLDVARRMYEGVGFREQGEFWGEGWIKGIPLYGIP
ncbi:acyl-CoA N-acyltransferase [Triangularia verruculosa]|uniref:Acyl-CoA N-acyltransferase n=1 Tax=Triangularia verruculosa TaxID=2587418 RepID=A0AAN6XE59_9PEZI|nr:acyl-CoA N-acyltransferase [Triangularia verruculosa]